MPLSTVSFLLPGNPLIKNITFSQSLPKIKGGLYEKRINLGSINLSHRNINGFGVV